LAFISAAGITQLALAEDSSSKAFDALYERDTPLGQSKYRMICDGKGHARIDSTLPDSKTQTTTIIDYNKKKSILLVVDQKTAWITDIAGGAQSGPMTDEKAKKLGAKSLGERVIHGHKCHGYAWVQKGSQCQTWTGDDTGCLVASVTNTAGHGKDSMRLLKYTAGAPPADTFEIPPGYKVQKMGQLGDITNMPKQ
jgi:hypothetical protein